MDPELFSLPQLKVPTVMFPETRKSQTLMGSRRWIYKEKGYFWKTVLGWAGQESSGSSGLQVSAFLIL